MSGLFTQETLSVAELNAAAKMLLEQRFDGIWVVGEISGLTRSAGGHYYFSLKDDTAQVRCALFKYAAGRLAPLLQEGGRVEVCGRIGIYEARGEFQITVQNVRQAGNGRLFEAYERLKAALLAEGLFDPARKQPLPARPARIGIVTSPAAAALRDVLTTLKRRAPEIPVILYPAPVQGGDSAAKIAQAVAAAAERRETDVLIVCRGGGSIEDLWAFNEEAVVRAVAACPIPVVSGVGHETDFTLTDFAADLRAPTPTAAAELVSPNRAESLQRLEQCSGRLKAALQQRYAQAAQTVDFLEKQIRHPGTTARLQQQKTAALAQSLQQAFDNTLRLHRRRLAQQTQLLHHLRPDTEAARQRLDGLSAALLRQRAVLPEAARRRLETQAALLDALSPQHTLERGFAVVCDTRGRIVRDAGTLKSGQKLNIRFAAGERGVRVEQDGAQNDLFD